MTRSILFYVSGHGFGHSTRVQAVMNEIPPSFRLAVRTSAPEWLYRENVRRGFEFYAIECDVGLIQKDSLTIDEGASLEAWLSFERNLPKLIEEETRFVRDQRIDLVLSDIPAFPFEIANRAGIPGLAMANFSWDWIYGRYVDRFPGFAPPVERLRESYSNCDLLFRLPFAGDLSAFPVHEEVPLVALRAEREPDDVRRVLGIPRDQRLVCVSFGGFDFDRFPWDIVARLKGSVLFTSAHPNAAPKIPNFISARGLGIRHHELVRAADLVISKPGYGIVSECIAGGTPILYTSRGDFAEYPILVEGIRKAIPSAYISNEDLLGENLPEKILDILNRDEEEAFDPMRVDGAEVVARRLISF